MHGGAQPMQRVQPNPMFAPQFLQSPWAQQQGYQPQVTSASMQGASGFAKGYRLASEFVAGTLVGGLIGYGFDWFGRLGLQLGYGLLQHLLAAHVFSCHG
jgi:hypothetical protein